MECKHHSGYDCGDLPMPHEAVPENRVKRAKKPPTNVQRLAVMLSIVLDEPYDDPENPSAIRIEQAKQLLPNWSSAQGSLMGAIGELVNLKAGYCVRCPLPHDHRGFPFVPEEGFVCPDCGRDYAKERAFA